MSIYLTYIIYGNINRYEARSVAVMVLQYLIAWLKRYQKIQAQVGLSIILAVFPPAFAVTFLFSRCQYKLLYSYTFYLVKHQLLESPITSAVTTHLTL